MKLPELAFPVQLYKDNLPEQSHNSIAETKFAEYKKC